MGTDKATGKWFIIQESPRPVKRGGRLVQALGRVGRGAGARHGGGWSGPHVTEGEVKNTAGGSVRRILTCFIARTPKLAETLPDGSVGGDETGPNMICRRREKHCWEARWA